ncbi:LysR family transcriptional regulator [Xanthomonas hyacinthi]|uniref:LysR family transcriptional regulator n=2 Tax=Xanthomonas hyacinthi TaxID=56455 RepID=A0A2S7ESN0_9XANT|nr:LysR family transcriptional regulator [Xanthomonas hyacinthi DSM 19077]PPU96084.1 LysR family transcriptional regulator [Xanthomonas hyacinthi]QGY75380.1 LysR family transcriptional regulator [Xanthomonas hyacinthi]
MNWDNARFFLAIARAGTLRGAARHLKVDQATVGRRLAALEDELGARLFLRTPSLYVLTPAGEALIEPAEAIERSVAQIERRVMGLDERLVGSIRVATTDSLGRHFVIPAIARMRAEHPGIDVVCLASQDLANLTRREADVAIRTVRPEAPDLIVRRLGTLQTGIYASRAYLAARGTPESGGGFEGHDLVLYRHPVAPTLPSALCGEPATGGQGMFQTSSTVMLVDATVAGLGVAELPCYRADFEVDLVRIMPQCSADFDVWLVAHADLDKTARIQALMSALVEQFARSRA